ncbi:DNA adenine methylase [Chromobacterium haemolyticum]|uniref:DNA adenine methylase n=1 Tax=Chromobacterium haemolyticum TaxID=394935 RepID=UPI00307FBDC3
MPPLPHAEFSERRARRTRTPSSAAHLRLSGTYVENLPWQEVMRRYDRAHTFFYCDPPYWQTEGYGVNFGFEQYQELAEFMRRCKGKVMVSINDHPDIRACFEGFHMESLGIKYAVANVHGDPKMSRELLIQNWMPDALGQLF